jgi:hypothetical protein
MEGPGKQYPCEKNGGLEPGRFKPIEEPGAEEKDPVVFTGLEIVWVTMDKVGIPTIGLDIHHGLYPPSLILALRVLTPLLTSLSQFLSVRIPLEIRLLVVSLTLLSYRIQSWLVLLRRFYLTLRSQCLLIWLPFLPRFLLWKLAIGSLFPLLVRKYPI